MPFNFNITGEISKKEVGLISIVLITTIGAVSTFEKNNLISIIFIGCAACSVLVYLMNFIYHSFESDWIGDKLPVLLLMEQNLGWEKSLGLGLDFSEENSKFLIAIYEQFYFRAIKEKKFELAEAFNNKINDIKNTTVKN